MVTDLIQNESQVGGYRIGKKNPEKIILLTFWPLTWGSMNAAV